MSDHAVFAVVRLVPILAIALASCGDNRVAPDAACHNTALQFAGGQYLDVADATELRGPLTIEFWVRVADGPRGIVLSHVPVGPPDPDPRKQEGGWYVSVENGVVHATIIFTPLHITGVGGGPLPAGWAHVAAVLGDFVGVLYIDGLEVGRSTVYPPGPGTVPLRIGTANDGQFGFSGMIDEIRLSRTLRYDGDFAVPRAPFVVDADTIALWHFSEGSGTTTVDATQLHPAVFPAEAAAQPVWTEGLCFDQMHP